MAAKLAFFFTFFLVAVYITEAVNVRNKTEAAVKEATETVHIHTADIKNQTENAAKEVHVHAVEIKNQTEQAAKEIAQAAEIPKNEQTAEQTIDGTIDKLKAGFEEFVDKVANNDIVKKTAQGIKDLGETLQQKGKEAIDKLTAETKTR
ncbi:uncharacterized protein [Diabrotica undecimpunctata]|uniref:uncharacterized protein n=1 Tax=Diabrotica undecimpunctata TaxID=50387 RepID=UPI003B63650E